MKEKNQKKERERPGGGLGQNYEKGHNKKNGRQQKENQHK